MKTNIYYNEALGLSRLRLVYPNGYVEWFPLWDCPIDYWMDSCWSKKSKGQKQSIKFMKKYDKNYGYPKDILIGVL